MPGNPREKSVVVNRPWAATVELETTSTPTSNRFLLLRDESNDKYDSDPFQVRESRRSVKRRRQQQHQQQEQAPVQRSRFDGGQQQPSRQPVQNTVPRRGCVIMTGRKVMQSGEKLAAAKESVKKAVFCVDNLNTSVTVDDLRKHVAGLSVNVLSCFVAKPRRRRNEMDRKAFRLCIADADRDHLLDESQWPQYDIISEWFFLNPADRRSAATTRE